MSRTYKATGINLKSMPLGESDRLLTILTREFGLVRAVAMGSRKHNSRLGGRSGLFVVNDLLIAKGRSLDKVAQAETLESYPRLGQDLKKLTASQYLAELSLCQALSEQPQEELFCLLNEHLKRLESAPASLVLAHLTHAVFQLLVLAGIAPQVHLCCVSRQQLIPDLANPDWRAGFSIPTGGTVTLAALDQIRAEKTPRTERRETANPAETERPKRRTQPQVAEAGGAYRSNASAQPLMLNQQITAVELALLQDLAQAELPQPQEFFTPQPQTDRSSDQLWLTVEHILRQYAQYHFDRPIRSAALVDACFLSLPTPTPPSEL